MLREDSSHRKFCSLSLSQKIKQAENFVFSFTLLARATTAAFIYISSTRKFISFENTSQLALNVIKDFR